MTGLARDGRGEATRVAAIDIGTNSVLLLVAERVGLGAAPEDGRQAAGGDAAVRAVVERATITRLGEGVDRTRALAPAAVERTLACLAEYAAELAALGVTVLDVVGTSAMRDAAGGEAFRERAAGLLGKAPRVISGDEEAELGFAGALVGLDVRGDVAVFDVGGGSTELAFGRAGAGRGGDVRDAPLAGGTTHDRARSRGLPTRACSLDVGSVRLTERHMRADPPRAEELVAVRAAVRAALQRAPSPPPGATWVGVAGTVTTLAAVHLGLAPYQPERVHGARLTRDDVEAELARLASLPLAARAALPGLEPRRADVVVAGAALVAEVLAWAGADSLTVSDRGVRWGLALRLLDGPAG